MKALLESINRQKSNKHIKELNNTINYSNNGFLYNTTPNNSRIYITLECTWNIYQNILYAWK